MVPRTRRALIAALTGTALVAGFTSAAAAAPSTGTDGLTLVAVKHSLLGTHTWYQQTYRGLPVVGGYYATHTDTRTGTTHIDDGRLAVGGNPATTAAVAESGARTTALARTGGTWLRDSLVIVPGTHATLAWQVLSDRADGSVRTMIDARTGSVLSSQDVVKEVDGTGTVFEPNPVVALQNETLTDNKDANSSAFTAAYKTVTLPLLDSSGGLSGSYAKNVSRNAVTSATHTFTFTRADNGFEQVEAYYSLTEAQQQIQSLGFTDVNNSAQQYQTTGLAADNSFYDPSVDKITYGTGGVDDAEDDEVIWHEYGHAIQDDQVPGFGSGSESGAIGEGFGDYWAFSMSSAVSQNTTKTPLACIADWDSTSYTSGTPHCLRRVDGTKTYPGSLDGEVHDDGEIWSRALYDIWNQLGRTDTDTLILEAQFNFTPNISMPAAATQIVNAAQSLYGATAASACTTAFHNRGIL
jgi:Zn-dependent metalloprotease